MPKARHTTLRDINAAERGKLALELRKSGFTLDEIAQRCGYSNRSGAYHAVRRELDRIPVENVNDLRKIEHMRLEQLHALVSSIVANEDAEEGTDNDTEGEEKPRKKKKSKINLYAVDRLIAISERRARLLGMDTPIEVAASSNLVVIREIPNGYLEGPKHE